MRRGAVAITVVVSWVLASVPFVSTAQSDAGGIEDSESDAGTSEPDVGTGATDPTDKGDFDASGSTDIVSEAVGDESEDGGEREYPPEAYEPAWALYREAFVELAAGNLDAAVEKLESLRKSYEDHPAALFAEPVLEKLEERREARDSTREGTGAEEAGSGEPRRTDRLGIEEATGLARAELVSFQTLHGIVLGAESCIAFSCRSARVGVSSLVVGGGTGLGLSLYLTRDGVTPGHALAINSGVEWGLWEAIGLNFLTRNWQSGPANSVLPLMFGQLAGLGVGAGVWQAYRPNAGDVAMVNAGGIWSGAFTALTFSTFGIPHNQQGLFGTLLLTTNLGGLGSTLFARNFPMSRGRMYVINTGGLLGGLLGVGLVILAGGDRIDSRVMSGSAMIGAGGGLAVSTLLTEGWTIHDGDSSSGTPEASSLFFRPTLDGEGALLSIGGSF